jgi:hypothetical protein
VHIKTQVAAFQPLRDFTASQTLKEKAMTPIPSDTDRSKSARELPLSGQSIIESQYAELDPCMTPFEGRMHAEITQDVNTTDSKKIKIIGK